MSKNSGVKQDKGTKIKSCFCTQKYQDQKYGPGMRVWNHAPQNKYKNKNRYRCSSCGRESEIG